ncbi:hypothetical protein AB0L88_10510 [Saccharopolyspora shandongensis]|uniref:hypothetical protein n=1 Tax=Saccharopolyspora shandongensis TaxID=418495 RepID=UPI003415E797
MTTPAPPPPPVPGGAGQTITVNKDNVLEVRKVILMAAEDAKFKLFSLAPSLGVSAPADDEISATAASVWTGNLLGNPDSHYARLMQYVTNVLELGQQIEEAAKQYGFTDDEIAASFQLQQKQI